MMVFFKVIKKGANFHTLNSCLGSGKRPHIRCHGGGGLGANVSDGVGKQIFVQLNLQLS